MAKRSTTTRPSRPSHRAPARHGVSASARSLKIAERGIKTAPEFASCMSALMGDLLAERVPIAVGNAVCSAGRNMLSIVALQMRYNGVSKPRGAQRRTLALIGSV